MLLFYTVRYIGAKNKAIIMNDKDFKKIFIEHKVDIPDDGFSEHVAGMLPKRKSILPLAVMIIFIFIGLAITFAIHGVTLLFNQINDLFMSVSQMQMPSLSSVVTYIGALALLGIIGYSIAQADAG